MPVAKISSGSSAGGCLGYVLRKAKAELLETNCESETPEALDTEFDVALEAHWQNGADRHVEQYVFHASLGFPIDCDLSADTLLAIAHDYMTGMGFDPVLNQYVIAAHHDTEHPHLHIVCNRVGLDGSTVPMWRNWERSGAVLAQIEAQYDLPRLRHQDGADVKAPTVAEVRQSRRLGLPIPRQVAQETVERCLAPGLSLPELTSRLQAEGVTLTATQRDDGQWALLYQLAIQGQQRVFSASKLGRRYTKRGLQSTWGITFDDATVDAVMETSTPVPGLPIVDRTPMLADPDLTTGCFVAELDHAGPSFVTELDTPEAQSPSGLLLMDLDSNPASGRFVSEPDHTDPGAPRFVPEPIDTELSYGQNVEDTPLDYAQEQPDQRIDAAVLGASDPTLPGFDTKSLTAETLTAQAFETTESSDTKLTAPPTVPVVEPVAVMAIPSEIAAPSGVTDAWTTPTMAHTADQAARAAGLQAIAQWTQTHIETLTQRALWVGLENATAQTQWETLAAQAQQQGLRDLQQIEYAVTGFACQQGYKDRTVVKILQQSPRVQAALKEHNFQTVTAVLTRSVVQVREALQQQEKARRTKTER